VELGGWGGVWDRFGYVGVGGGFVVFISVWGEGCFLLGCGGGGRRGGGGWGVLGAGWVNVGLGVLVWFFGVVGIGGVL